MKKKCFALSWFHCPSCCPVVFSGATRNTRGGVEKFSGFILKQQREELLGDTCLHPSLHKHHFVPATITERDLDFVLSSKRRPQQCPIYPPLYLPPLSAPLRLYCTGCNLAIKLQFNNSVKKQ